MKYDNLKSIQNYISEANKSEKIWREAKEKYANNPSYYNAKEVESKYLTYIEILKGLHLQLNQLDIDNK